MSNTDNEKIESENLEEPLKILVEELTLSNVRKYTCVNLSGYSQLERNIVEKITNWQKEKDKAVIETAKELMRFETVLRYGALRLQYPENCLKAIKELKQLLNTLK